MDLSPDSFLAEHARSILVEVAETRGSAPRDKGAFMMVSEKALQGSIGGGQLEYLAIALARRMLAGEVADPSRSVALGPEIGQCCGGQVSLRFRHVDDALAAALVEREREALRQQPQIVVFGAGHVGLALARALVALPFRVTLVETRDIYEGDIPSAVDLRTVAIPEAVVKTVDSGGSVLIVTHDHALDFLIARQALARSDLAYIGMIGSSTKRATFVNWLSREHGEAHLVDRLVLPIGGTTVSDKRPAVIAAMVAAELLAVYATRNPAG